MIKSIMPQFHRVFALGAVAAFACLGTPPRVSDPNSKISPELQRNVSGQEFDVIVQMKSDAVREARGRVMQKATWRRHRLPVINAEAYRIAASELAALAADPDVEFIHKDHPLHATAFTGTADYGWMTAINAISPTATLPYDGTGIGVAILDSGIDEDYDLKDSKGYSRIVYHENFAAGEKNAADGYGHGNHVAGIVAGNGQNSTGEKYDYTIRGLASNANLINLRVLDSNGGGRDSDVIAAISRAISLKYKYNIRVLNLSLGRPISTACATDLLCQAVESAWKAGIVVVVAAGNNGRDNSSGNDGYGTITAPGNSPSAITVGAMNTVGTPDRIDDKLASYSSTGPSFIDHYAKPDLVAPGNRIISLRDSGSTLDKSYPENRVPKFIYSLTYAGEIPDYYQLSGTSMAAPMVSAAAALLIQQNPALTPDQVKARLMLTASKFSPGVSIAVDPSTGVAYTSHYDVFTTGAGYLDVQAALANRDLADLPARSPVAAYDAASGVAFLVGDPATVWDNRAKWGLSAVWGTNSVSPSRSVWNLTSISSDGTTLATRSVWGLAIIGGPSAVWTSAGTGTPQTGVIGDLSISLNGEN